jgi:hypothetical protein
MAAAEVDEARRVADADRADASRIRAEAEAYAKDMRAAADSFAEQGRRGVEREAAQIVADAQKRLAAADADVEQKVRKPRRMPVSGRKLLQVEVQRYEERIENILVVFRGMGSQLEDLLGRQRTESRNLGEASDKALEDALRPGPFEFARWMSPAAHKLELRLLVVRIDETSQPAATASATTDPYHTMSKRRV